MVRKMTLDDCKQKNGKTFYAVGFLPKSQERFWGYGQDPISAIRLAYDASGEEGELPIRCVYGDNWNMDVTEKGHLEFRREPPIPVGVFRVNRGSILPVTATSKDCPMTCEEWIQSIHDICEKQEWSDKKIQVKV